MSTDLDSILVSVIIPTYRRSELLPRALDSVLSQTHNNLEVLVINDNIPDSDDDLKTTSVLNLYAGDSRLKHVRTTGKAGGGAARNKGLSQCQGEYIAFLDDDDMYLPDKIGKQLAFTHQNQLDMSYQDIQWYNSDNKLVEYRRHDRVQDFSIDGLMRVHLQTSIAPTSIYMVRKAALQGVEGFGEVPRGQDFHFMVHCIQAGLQIGYMPGAYVIQYLHDGERISQGPEFVKNVTEEWAYKRELAKGLLNRGEKRYMEFRYQCICAMGSLRSGYKQAAVQHAVKAIFISPVNCFKEAYRYFGGRFKHKR